MPFESFIFIEGKSMAFPRSARISNDPDRYIRPTKGGKFQARPYCEGRRYDLGIFATKASARVAILKFFRGEIVSKPRFVRRCYGREGVFYIAMVCVPDAAGVKRTIRVGDRYKTPAEAQAVAINYLDRTLGEEARIAMMPRPHLPCARRSARKSA
jgi:hypothetical protein